MKSSNQGGNGSVIWTMVFATAALGFLIWGGVSQVKAHGTQGEVYGVDTFYDQRVSVYCATRLKSISCVYVPRDTVHSVTKEWGD